MPDPDLLIAPRRDAHLKLPALADRLYRVAGDERLWPDFRGIHLLEAMPTSSAASPLRGLSDGSGEGKKTSTHPRLSRLLSLGVSCSLANLPVTNSQRPGVLKGADCLNQR